MLVVGLGPAGYTLSHYLLNEGFGVVAIDGLKIEPLPVDITGDDDNPPRPIRQWSEIYRPLDERVLEGFGGVSEYGITVRWDKNFLTLLHLTLARRRGIRIYGGVRFGGTIPLGDAWGYGFDHVAIAVPRGELEAQVSAYRTLGFREVHREDVLGGDQVREVLLEIGSGPNLIQLLEPLREDSPVQKLIDKNGGKGGFAHYALRVADIHAAFGFMQREGFKIIDKAPRPG